MNSTSSMDKFEKVKAYVEKYVDELWEDVPDAEDVIEERCTPIQYRDLGMFMGFEMVERYIHKLEEEAKNNE